MLFEEVLGRIRERYGTVEVMEFEGMDVVLVPGEAPIVLPPHLPTDTVAPLYLEFICLRLSMLDPTDLGLDWKDR